MTFFARSLALSLSIGLLGVGPSVVSAAQSVTVVRVSPKKIEKAVGRLHLTPQMKKFVIGRLQREASEVSPGERSELATSTHRWGTLVAFAHGPQGGAKAVSIAIPRGDHGGVHISVGQRFLNGMRSKTANDELRIVRSDGSAREASFKEAWDYAR
jgi:hypothetical protein